MTATPPRSAPPDLAPGPDPAQARLRIVVQSSRPTLQARVVGTCPDCDGSGFRDGLDTTSVTMCRCHVARVRAELLTGARIPFVAAGANLKAMRKPGEQGDAVAFLRGLAAMQRAVQGEPGAASLVTLIGAPGTGKTWLACAVLRWAILALGVRGLYVNARDAITMLSLVPGEDGWRHTSEPRQDRIVSVLSMLRNVPVLVLDEVGHQRVPFAREIVENTIAGRVDDGRATFVCSNHDPAALAEIFGESVADRLCTGGETYFFAGESRRSERR